MTAARTSPDDRCAATARMREAAEAHDVEGVVATLDEEGRQPPFVVDYMDVHLDRFVMAQQEYNVGHWSLPAFRDALQTVLTGRERPGPGVLHALTAVSGFWSGQLLFDPAQHGAALDGELPIRLVVHLRADNVGRKQIRRELNALKGRPNSFGESAHREGLGKSRHAFEQHMAARE